MTGSDTAPTQILKSYYAGLDSWAGLFNYRVLRAGHIRTGPGYRIARDNVPGHEFLFCVGGAGYVKVDNRSHRVLPGELAWLPVQWPHAHAPDRDDPWELLWLRVDGPKLDTLMAVLAVRAEPVFRFARPAEVRGLFDAVLSHVSPSSLLANASCDTLVASLIERLLESRSNRVLEPQVTAHQGLARLMAEIHIHYNDAWDIDKFAGYCRVSKSHLFRLFKAAFGQTPLHWLRDFRIAQAKRLLLETDAPVATVSRRVGYDDPLHFSRDFKKHVGVSPSQFRDQEKW
ncbi:AraC family transcriptional regulator [Azospirillum sp. ST 5-10]|uniref:helix-turn-helix transcriptional regulator n=1 Tax=unclassified Azospirillum TaxID=2630922 RepID=UPI003F4A0622